MFTAERLDNGFVHLTVAGCTTHRIVDHPSSVHRHNGILQVADLYSQVKMPNHVKLAQHTTQSIAKHNQHDPRSS